MLPDWVHVGCSNIAAAILHHGHNPRRRVTIRCETRVFGVPFGICYSLIDPAIGWLPFGSDWVVNPAYGGDIGDTCAAVIFGFDRQHDRACYFALRTNRADFEHPRFVSPSVDVTSSVSPILDITRSIEGI